MYEPGTLSELVEKATEKALDSGALLTLHTHSEIVEECGIPFLVRILSSRLRKEQSAVFEPASPGRSTNPFLPYDRRLYVADLSATHVCLLNKYNVVSRHLIMVTREFVPQETTLTPEDFRTVALCLSEFDGLAFYNSDATAGASQPHKHLQFVPLNADPDFQALPIEAAAPGSQGELPARSPRLPFRQGWICLEAPPPGEWESLTEQLHRHYCRLLDFVGRGSSYNLLVTRRWVMMVPRSRESFRSISVNSLGYAGSLLVKNREQMDWIKRAGPMEVLRLCAQS